VIYTDGSCKGNPGPGGWGTLILAEGRETRLSGGEITTTNNRMELTAAIEALRAVRDNPAWKGRPVRLHIDSEYVRKGITGWISLWKTKDWRTSTRQPVKNRDLWEELDALNAGLSVEWVWVRGHDGDYYNEICDEMARFESARSKP
jgi:ribonuclease HI